MSHPFEKVSMHRIAQSNPKFLENLDIESLHRNISFERAKRELGGNLAPERKKPQRN